VILRKKKSCVKQLFSVRYLQTKKLFVKKWDLLRLEGLSVLKRGCKVCCRRKYNA